MYGLSPTQAELQGKHGVNSADCITQLLFNDRSVVNLETDLIGQLCPLSIVVLVACRYVGDWEPLLNTNRLTVHQTLPINH